MGGLVGGGGGDAKAAKAQLAQQQAETQRLRQQAEMEKRDMAEEMAAKTKARQRGGARMLLSDSEEGVEGSDVLGG
jgi:microcystin degradation protein MlrC